jgi:hypothetical protein
MHLVEDIDGTAVARAQAAPDEIFLQLMSPAGFATESGSHYPAESFTLASYEGIAALYDLCGRLLEAWKEENGE